MTRRLRAAKPALRRSKISLESLGVKKTTPDQDEARREQAMRNALSQNGKSLWDLSHDSPLLVIFLRHFG